MKNKIVQVLVGDRFRVSDRTHTWRTKLSRWWSVTVFGCWTGHTRGEQNCPGAGWSPFSSVGQDTHVENKIVQVVVGHGSWVWDRSHTWRTELSRCWLVTVFGCRTGYTRGEQNCPGGDRSRFSGVGQDTHVENNIVQATWWLVTVFECRKTLAASKLRYPLPPNLSPVPIKP